MNIDPSSNKNASLVILSIPEDQWQIILSFVTSSDLLQIASVSTHLRDIATRTYTLITDSRSIENQNGSLLSQTPQNAADPVSSFTRDPISCYTRSSRVHNTSFTMGSTFDSFTNYMNNDCDGRKQQYTNLFQRFRHLRTLILNDLSSMQDSILPIINTSPSAVSLKHLELHGVRILKDGHALNLRGNGDTGDTSARLRHVALSGTLFCSYQNVLKSFTTSPDLQYLELSGCRLLTDADIQSLIATRTHLFHQTNIRDQLQALSLSNSSQLTKPVFEFGALRSLDLSNCPKLKNLPSIACPNLVDLNLSYCTSLVDRAVSSVLSNCPLLKSLNLCACNGLRKLVLESDSLVRLDVGLCCELVTIEISCDCLESLKIGICNKLERFGFNGAFLKEVDLSMLPMSELEIVAPSLQDLMLSGCFKLSNSGVQCKCPKLKNLDICGTNLSSKHFRKHSNMKMNISTGGSALNWDI